VIYEDYGAIGMSYFKVLFCGRAEQNCENIRTVGFNDYAEL
jgi:hypothetical protein